MNASWKIEGIPVPQYELSVTVDRDKKLIELTECIMGEFYRERIELKSAAVRQALIAQGWTPPLEEGHE